ncbi:Rhophilin-2 [Eumeta japonica]|uniref:Rhophilin-2 n=1 Tax=Eumeta variegata TaxID=151549 RepID=A0A4C1VPY4_EUMVA|nr:Rhophilin-2 [Eumeta japonica]
MTLSQHECHPCRRHVFIKTVHRLFPVIFRLAAPQTREAPNPLPHDFWGPPCSSDCGTLRFSFAVNFRPRSARRPPHTIVATARSPAYTSNISTAQRKATTNRKLRETVALELSFVNSNLQLLKEQLAELNSSVELYQSDSCKDLEIQWILQAERRNFQAQ